MGESHVHGLDVLHRTVGVVEGLDIAKTTLHHFHHSCMSTGTAHVSVGVKAEPCTILQFFNTELLLLWLRLCLHCHKIALDRSVEHRNPFCSLQ